MSPKPSDSWWKLEITRRFAIGMTESARDTVESLRSAAKTGQAVPGKSTIAAFLKDLRESASAVADPVPLDADSEAEASDLTEADLEAVHADPMSPTELTVALTEEFRRAQASVRSVQHNGGNREAVQKAQRVFHMYATLLAKTMPREKDDGEVIKVTMVGVQAAADRALRDLTQLASSIVEEMDGWPKCEGCGRSHGVFASAEVSPLRALFEKVARS